MSQIGRCTSPIINVNFNQNAPPYLGIKRKKTFLQNQIEEKNAKITKKNQ